MARYDRKGMVSSKSYASSARDQSETALSSEMKGREASGEARRENGDITICAAWTLNLMRNSPVETKFLQWEIRGMSFQIHSIREHTQFNVYVVY